MFSLRRGRRNAHPRGQSLVEFALVLPVLLVIMLFAIDFGRAFFSWVTVTNASRVAANYAAVYPRDSYSMSCGGSPIWNCPAATNPYVSQVGMDAAGAFSGVCPLKSGTDFLPVFTDGPDFKVSGDTSKDLGDSARVTINCTFRPLTPVISNIVGSSITISASSTFTIRTGF